jgi:orotidine-5'-phosphate decarboxylase
MNFLEKLLAAQRQQRSLLCVGLDPEVGRLPASLLDLPIETAITRFCHDIIEATAPYACVYKPNLAFFEVLGVRGMQVFAEVIKGIPAHIPVLADAKRGDVGVSARNYAAALLDVYDCDAVTVNPYLGLDSVAPFLAYQEKGVFLVCRTSNPDARDLQDILVQSEDGSLRPLYEAVAQKVLTWNQFGNCGLVVGATYPAELAAIRTQCPNLPILIPGIGAQGGDVEAAVRAGVDAHGERAILSASRSILYASDGKDYASDAQEQARLLHEQINKARGL